MPAKALTIYIPYSYMLVKAEEKFNKAGFIYSWRHFCDSEIYRKLLVNYSKLLEQNTKFVGYPKMDTFFEPCEKDPAELWKLSGVEQKKIIYAPHHSLKNVDYCSSHFATFDKNGQFILEPQTDFIFAVAGEELGFIGTATIIILLLLITIECILIARKAKDMAGKLICCGMAALVGFQSIVNISVTSGLLPNTGLPLPFVSYGLTSLLSLYIGVGLVLNVGLQPKKYYSKGVTVR